MAGSFQSMKILVLHFSNSRSFQMKLKAFRQTHTQDPDELLVFSDSFRFLVLFKHSLLHFHHLKDSMWTVFLTSVIVLEPSQLDFT